MKRPRAPNAIHRYGPWALVLLAVLFCLWVLRAEATPVANLNDGAIHRSMIAWAEQRWAGGHLPLDGWYPQVGLGSSRFHHYQSLPHVLTGLLALGTGSERAYSWSLYVLLALWPVSIYCGGRLWGLGRWRSACAALASPLIVSAPTLGYEWGSYAWRGYGTWTQLWGMWLLPLAWGLSLRAVSRGRWVAWAALVVAMTIAVHLLTGYLALLSLGVLVLLRPTRLLRRLGRAAVVGVGALTISAWVLVPLLLDRAYSIQDEFSRGKVFYDSFGARQVLSWMVTGELFDRDRLPVLSVLAAVGLLLCLWRWRRDERARAVVALGLLSLLLFFGRSTLGPMLRLLPGSGDLFLRRYVFGVHLAGLYLIGYALAWGGRLVVAFVARRWRSAARPALAAGVAVAVVALAPAWLERSAWAAQGAVWIEEQRVADATGGADVAELVALAERRGPGRFYGGMRSNWGSDYRIGQVPMYAMLVNLDVDQLGFTRPTWSLASPAEYRFRDSDPAHYDVFDVRYAIVPSDRAAPIAGAERIAERGGHVLYEMPTTGLFDVVAVGEPLAADRLDLGATIAPWLSSDEPEAGVVPGVAFGAFAAPKPTGAEAGSPGTVLAVDAALDRGTASAVVRMERPGALVLKTSFDNRWSVSVDGEPVAPQMFAPGFVGRELAPGRHVVVFVYRPFPRYDALLLLGAAAFAVLLLGERRGRRRRRAVGAAPSPDAGYAVGPVPPLDPGTG